MRAIDADALIADCQLAQKQADRHGREFANAFYSGGGEVSTEWWCVEDMIENAPTIEPQQRWIPCSERLPDEEVLCCDTRGEMIIGYPYPDEESNTGFSAESDDVFMIDCAAWMPLPKSYRAERRTDET